MKKAPGRLWSHSAGVATLITDRSHRQPSRRKLLVIRLAVLAGLILFAPVLLFFHFRLKRETAYDTLDKRVRELWETSADEAMALLRTTYEELVARGAFTQSQKVEIPPFGTFGFSETFSVQQFLYGCEVGLGNYEAALAVTSALPAKIEYTILQQVDCLVALGRRADAIALLERNLGLDSWRRKLHRRLVELGGKPLRLVN